MKTKSMTRTYAVLQVSKQTYDEIHSLLAEANYGDQLLTLHSGVKIIDMNGIALRQLDEPTDDDYHDI